MKKTIWNEWHDITKVDEKTGAREETFISEVRLTESDRVAVKFPDGTVYSYGFKGPRTAKTYVRTLAETGKPGQIFAVIKAGAKNVRRYGA
jgi:hypothetical protein